MKKYKIVIGIFIVVAVIVFLMLYKLFYKSEVVINGYEIGVEVADTIQKQKKGLSGREKMCENCGMFFIFDESGQHKFWMKDMQFDIDIVWIRDDKIVDLSKNVSHKTQNKIIMSDEDVDSVLEIQSGKIDELTIMIGCNVKYKE